MTRDNRMFEERTALLPINSKTETTDLVCLPPPVPYAHSHTHPYTRIPTHSPPTSILETCSRTFGNFGVCICRGRRQAERRRAGRDTLLTRAPTPTHHTLTLKLPNSFIILSSVRFLARNHWRNLLNKLHQARWGSRFWGMKHMARH